MSLLAKVALAWLLAVRKVETLTVVSGAGRFLWAEDEHPCVLASFSVFPVCVHRYAAR